MEQDNDPQPGQQREHVGFDDIGRVYGAPEPGRAGRSTLAGRIGGFLRSESSGGLLLIIGAFVAIVWANTSAAASYFGLKDVHLAVPLGFTTLDLSLAHWAADGLLAVFFFVVGVELKEEFVVGELHSPRTALTPVVAAAGGVIVPAVIFTLLNLGAGAETLRGWAIPTATDIAFAVAVLGVVGRWLPKALRLFLLTLAVVDDLIAILIIAVFYTQDLHFGWLAATLIPFVAFGFLVQVFPRFFQEHHWAPWLILLPLGIIAWVCMFQSGIHSTIAGVVLGFLVPAKRRHGEPGDGLAQSLDHRVGPFSAGIAVPVFAFFSAGVAIGGAEGIKAALTDPVVWGIVVGLVVGKPIGILSSTWLLTRLPFARLHRSVRWRDLAGVGILGGIGFTVSLLVAELSFGEGSPHDEHAKVAILTGSLLAAVIAALWLIPSNRYYKRKQRQDGVDADEAARELNEAE